MNDVMITADAATRRRPVRSYVLRAGRMGSGQQRAMAELAPRFVLPFRPAALDTAAAFGRQAPVVVEIGFGMGQATAAIATARPDLDFIGIEVHEPGVGALLKRIGEARISNLRIVQHDAVEVVRDMLAPDSVAGIHVFFPDPWPKARHHKRRLIRPAFVSLLASRLKPGGYLHCATDWEHYAVQMLSVLSGEPLLANTAGPVRLADTAAQCAGFAPRPEYRPQTKFERRGLRLGHQVWDVVFVRRPS